MAIMVTDPRNNLLSQLTAVGQQYLAGKQQERMSATEFSNKKALIELMDRLGGASDTREFEQEKVLQSLRQQDALGLLDAGGKLELARLERAGKNAVDLAAEEGRWREKAVSAGKPAPFDLPGSLNAISTYFGGSTPNVELPALTPELRSTIIDMGGEDALRAVVGALDDPAKLRDLMVETEGNPLGVMLSTLRTPGSPRNKAVVDFFNNRADSLERKAKLIDQLNVEKSDKGAILQAILPLALNSVR